jgi:hypothetical protein
MRFSDFSQSLPGDVGVPLRPSATFRCGVTQLRSHKTLLFESLQCGINTAQRDLTATYLFNLTPKDQPKNRNGANTTAIRNKARGRSTFSIDGRMVFMLA